MSQDAARAERMMDALRIAKSRYFDLWDEATHDGSHIGEARNYDAIWHGLEDAIQVIEGLPDTLAQSALIGAKHATSGGRGQA